MKHFGKLALAACVAAGAAVWLSRVPSNSMATNEVRRAPAAHPQAIQAATSVAQQGLSSVSLHTSNSTVLPRIPQSADVRDLLAGQDLAGLYRRVLDLTTPEALYIKASIYAKCATRGNVSEAQRAAALTSSRANFRAGLVVDDPAAPRRAEAYDKMMADQCAGLQLGAFDRNALAHMLQAAADGGDPRAQAWLMTSQIEAKYFAAQAAKQPIGGLAYGDQDLAAARTLLASGDPEAAEDMRNMLSSTLDRGALKLNGQVVDPYSMHAAMGLFACDLGASCGPDSQELQIACALQGRCGSTTLRDYINSYASPEQALQIDAYHQALLGMYRTHDFSAITLVPTAGSTATSIVFGGRHPS